MNNNHSNDFIDDSDIAYDRSSGRVTWDDRGNSVWEWQTAPGVYSRDADTQRVKTLQMADLELLEAPTRSHERAFCVSRAKDYPSQGGMNLPERGNFQPEDKPQRTGLIKRLIGR